MIGIGIGIPHSRNIRRLKYLLDEDFAQGATAAYALRLLREKHSGGIVRCRADDSGTTKGEADVLPIRQPDGSKIITLNSPIENFTGTPFSGDGYVLADLVDAGNGNYDGLTSSWYDQSGNLNDASNSNASQQPQIVSSGSVIKEGNEPSIDWSSGFMVAILPQTITIGDFSVYTSFTMIQDGNQFDRIFTQTKGTLQDFKLTPNTVGQRLEAPLTIVNKQATSSPISVNKQEKNIIKTLKNNNDIKFGKNLQPFKTNASYVSDIDRFLISTQDPTGLTNPAPMKLNFALAYFEDKRAEDNDITNKISDLFNVF